MTDKEAIELLDNLIGMIEDNQDNDYDEAFKMGIKALKNQKSLEEELEKIKKEFEDDILLNQTVAIRIIEKYIKENKQ